MQRGMNHLTITGLVGDVPELTLVWKKWLLTKKEYGIASLKRALESIGNKSKEIKGYGVTKQRA